MNFFFLLEYEMFRGLREGQKMISKSARQPMDVWLWFISYEHLLLHLKIILTYLKKKKLIVFVMIIKKKSIFDR